MFPPRIPPDFLRIVLQVSHASEKGRFTRARRRQNNWQGAAASTQKKLGRIGGLSGYKHCRRFPSGDFQEAAVEGGATDLRC